MDATWRPQADPAKHSADCYWTPLVADELAIGDALVDWRPSGRDPSALDALWRAERMFVESVPGSAIYGELNRAEIPGSGVLRGTASFPHPASALLQAFAYFSHEASAIRGVRFVVSHASAVVLAHEHDATLIASGLVARIDDQAILEIHVMDPAVREYWAVRGGVGSRVLSFQ